MSRRRVIKGEDERGRPQGAWAEAEPGEARPYGHMEPAFEPSIERRKATPEELAAARAREVEPSHLTVAAPTRTPSAAVYDSDPARTAASRRRGPDRHVEVVAARKPVTAVTPSPVPEELVFEPSANIPDPIPEPTILEAALAADGLDEGLGRLHGAITTARQAWKARLEATEASVRADAAFEEARAAIVQVWADTGLGIAPDAPAVPEVKPLLGPRGLATSHVTGKTPPGPQRDRIGEGQRSGQAAARDRRAEMVMAAMRRLDNNMAAVAIELGMKKNAVAQIVKHARRRASVG